MTHILRRWGSSPAQCRSTSGETCPDVLELVCGDFLIIGKAAVVKTSALAEMGAAIGPDETAVIVPREVLLTAARDLAKTPPTTVTIHVQPDPPHTAEAIRDVRRYGPGRR